MKLTSDDIKYIDQVHEILRKGHFPDGNKLIELYKTALADEIAKGKYQSNMNPKCGSCLKKVGEILFKEKERMMNIINEQLRQDEETVEEQDRGSEKASDIK